MNWYENEKIKNAIEKSDMSLLEFHQTAEWNSLGSFGTHKNIMMTVLFTLIAVGLALITIESIVAYAAAIIVPSIIVILRQYTVETLDRYYGRFLEAVVVQRKLRFAMGIGSEETIPFQADKYLEVSRRGGGTLDCDSSSIWVREYLEKGHNQIIWRFFRTLSIVSGAIPVLVGIEIMNSGIICQIVIIELIVVSWLIALLLYRIGTKQITKIRSSTYGFVTKKSFNYVDKKNEVEKHS